MFLLAFTGTLLLAFVAFSAFTWVRVLEAAPHSSGCASSLVRIAQQSEMVRPYFLGTFVVGTITFGLSRQSMGFGSRFFYLVVLGCGAGLLIMPWLVALFFAAGPA